MMDQTKRTVSVIPAAKPLQSPHKAGDKKLRVAAYCRVSTEQEEQLSSYKAQIDYYTAAISQNPAWSMAGIYADEGITGTNTKNRTAFNRMIADCGKGKIDMVITKSISRFARNTVDCLTYIRQLKDLGIPVYFEKENINTMDAAGEFVLTVLSSMAQEESRNISANIRWALEKRYEAGTVRLPPLYGYSKGPDGSLVIEPRAASHIKTIYKLYLEGYSLGKIKKHLEEEGISSPRGHATWDRTVIAQMLQNEKYTGDAILQKTYSLDFISHKRLKNNGEVKKYHIQNCHPPIISKEIFQRVQDEMGRRRKNTEKSSQIQKAGKGHGKFALSSLLVCGKCGIPYQRITWHAYQQPKVVWRCQNRVRHGKKYCPHSPSIEEQALKKRLMQIILDLAEDDARIIDRLQKNISEITWSEALNKRLQHLNFACTQASDPLLRLVFDKIEVQSEDIIKATLKGGAELTSAL